MGAAASLTSELPEGLDHDLFQKVVGKNYSIELFNALKDSKGIIRRGDLFNALKVQFDQSSILAAIPWDELTFVDGSEIGSGSFGFVHKGLWARKKQLQRTSKRKVRSVPVAVKIMTKNHAGKDYDMMLERTREEAARILEINERGGDDISDSIIKVYGFAEGPLPPKIAEMFSAALGTPAYGVVMRLETGGSLETYLHSTAGIPQTPLNTVDKIRLICRIIRAVGELHYLGVVNGDLKPANILLTSSFPPDVRIADFGLSQIRELVDKTLAMSTMRKTSAGMRGTPVYAAPEMSEEDDDDQVASASRSTDIYAFAIIAWEVLARMRPFADVKNPTSLANKVSKGLRPPIDALPPDTPPLIKDMIQRCWSADRSNRMFTLECISLVERELSILENSHFDLFFSHRWAQKHFLSHVYRLLTAKGYRVWYDQSEMGFDLEASMKNGIDKSSVFLACLDSGYQQRPNCMLELKHARASSQPPKPVVTIFLEEGPMDWASDDIKTLCDVQRTMYVDFSSLAVDPRWKEEHVEAELLQKLADTMPTLLNILNDSSLHCKPSMGFGNAAAVARVLAEAERCGYAPDPYASDASSVAEYDLGFEGTKVGSFTGHRHHLRQVIELQDGRICSACLDKTVKIWSKTTRACEITFTIEDHAIDVIQLPGSRRIAIGGWDGKITLWDIDRNDEAVAVLLGHTNGLTQLLALPDGCLCSGSVDNALKVWDLESMVCEKTLKMTKSFSWMVLLSDGRLCVCNYGELLIISTESFEIEMSTDSGHDISHGINRIIQLADGRLCTCSRDDTIKIFRLADLSCEASWTADHGGIFTVYQLTNGILCHGSGHGTVKMWNLAPVDMEKNFEAHANWVGGFRQLSDGSLLTIGGDYDINIWK